MLVAPRPGHHYRDTKSLQLVPADGFEADPSDFDIDRALRVGDLAPVEDSPKAARPKKAKAGAKVELPPAASEEPAAQG